MKGKYTCVAVDVFVCLCLYMHDGRQEGIFVVASKYYTFIRLYGFNACIGACNRNMHACLKNKGL